MIEPRPGMTPRELIPGDPDEVDRLAERLARFARSAGQAGERLAALDDPHWSGTAAEAFRDAVGEVPAAFRAGAGAFQEAAEALSVYAQVLRAAWRTAAEAVRLVEDAARSSAAWRAAGAAGMDPGEPARERARMLTRRAGDEVRTAAASARRRIAAATTHAPAGRSDLVAGAVPGVRTSQAEISVVVEHALAQPEQYVAPLDQVVSDVHFGADHQVPFVGADRRGANSWDQWAAQADDRSVGTVGAHTVAAAGIVALFGREGRRGHTAMQTAGADTDTLRRRGASARPHRDGGPGPSQVSVGWRTNLAGHPRTTGTFRVWAGAEGSPLGRTIPASAVTLGVAGESAPGVILRNGPPAEEDPAAPGAKP
ncbi:MAG: hypothetical protein HYR62_04585 [Actinobacteria bacterium]|nr:hypothetical protein [Actinomycetota bacterium]MBI3686504.1 hypothetical protein [Actinomycetota bacterium]